MEIDMIKEMAAKIFSVPKEKIHEDSHLVEELGADSLELYQMIQKMEETFDLTLSEDCLPALATIRDVVALLKEKEV